MIKSCCAIVLRTIKYNDNSDIIDTYTNIGRMSFSINKSRKKGKIPVAVLCQPLSILDIETDIDEKKNIHKVKELSPSIIFKSISINPFKQSMVFFLAEFLSHILKENMEDKQTFDYIKNSIEWLDNCKDKYANFHLIFLIKISTILGIYPNTTTYSSGKIFDLQNAIFSSELPEHGNYLNANEAHIFYNLLRLKYETMHLFKMNRNERNRCLDIIIKYYSIHATDLNNIKSIKVIKDLFI